MTINKKMKNITYIIILLFIWCSLHAKEQTPLTEFFDPILGNWYGAVYDEDYSYFSYEYVKIGYKFEDIAHIELFSKTGKDILSYVKPSKDGNGCFINSEIFPVRMESFNIFYDRTNNCYIGFFPIGTNVYIGKADKGNSIRLLTLPSNKRGGVFDLESSDLYYEFTKNSLNDSFIVSYIYPAPGEYLRAYRPLKVDLSKEAKETFFRFNFFSEYKKYTLNEYPKIISLFNEFEEGKLDSQEYKKLQSSISNYTSFLKQFPGEWSIHKVSDSDKDSDKGRCWVISDGENLTLFSKLSGSEGEYYILKNITYKFSPNELWSSSFISYQRKFSIIEGEPLRANVSDWYWGLEAWDIDFSKGYPSEILFARHMKNPKLEKCIKWVFSDDYKTISEYIKNGTDDWIPTYIYKKIQDKPNPDQEKL